MSGTKNYALVIQDKEKADKFFKDNNDLMIAKKYNKIFENSNLNLSFEERVNKSVLNVIGDSKDSGILFLVAEDKKKANYKKVK